MHNDVPHNPAVEVRPAEEIHNDSKESRIQVIEAERESIEDGLRILTKEVAEKLSATVLSERPKNEDFNPSGYDQQLVEPFNSIQKYERKLEPNNKTVASLTKGANRADINKYIIDFKNVIARIRKDTGALKVDYVTRLSPENRLSLINSQIRDARIVESKVNRLRIPSPILTIEAATKSGRPVDVLQLEIDVRKAVERAEPELKRLQEQLDVSVDVLSTIRSSIPGELQQTRYKDIKTYQDYFEVAAIAQSRIDAVTREYKAYRQWCEKR